MPNGNTGTRFTPRDFWAWLFEIFDRYGIVILGALLLVYPFIFQGLIDFIFWSEDSDLEYLNNLAEILTVIRGFVPSTPLMIQILIFSLFGMAFNILLGNTGMLSLGHCAYFGVGGYTLGLMHAWFKEGTPVYPWITDIFKVFPLEFSVISAIIVSALVAWLIGLIASTKRGVYFAMVTLALSMVFYYAAQTFDDLTGGTDGLGGLVNMRLGTLDLRVGIMDATITYYFVFVIVVAATAIIWQILRSPFGQALRAVRENETRARNCGYDTAKIRHTAFVLSGSLSGLAGALSIIYGESVPIENIHFLTSGQIVIITLFGGAGVFLGPAVGSFIYWYLRQLMSTEFVKYKIICIPKWGCLGDIFQYWEAWVGGIFMLIVIFVPQGILGSINNLTLNYRAKRYMEQLGGETESASTAESEES